MLSHIKAKKCHEILTNYVCLVTQMLQLVQTLKQWTSHVLIK